MIKKRSTIKRQINIFRRIIITIFLLAIAMLFVMIFGTMEDQVKGDGKVTGIRDYYIKSLVDAKTVKIIRYEGELVQRDEALVEFDSRDLHDRVTMLKNEIEELKKEINVKDKALAMLLKDPLPEYYRHTKLSLDEAETRLERSKYELEVYSKLFEQKVISRREFLKVEMEDLTNRSRVRRLKADWEKLQDGMAKEIIEKAEGELELLRQRLISKEQEVKLSEQHIEDYIIRAPDSGILTDIPPRPGGYFEKGEVVVKLAANQNKKVIALIDEKQIYKVQRGQKARIASRQYNYFDYGYFDGQVQEIYQLPIDINGVNHYPVKILLINEPQPLRFGSSCEVTIIAGQERIIFIMLGLRSKDYLKRRGLTK
ncbi:MAG: HlyD family efflux transporter periplasmic adaptor subunit [Victivallaceae bacterium]|nr:HlyD family efflux transporter periplasmic adaptor subunit [Victivallaceae bacterium]MDD4180803.1 HlyD family efflux transporter periplasmic adaptor subunit [Victivallaceae bacterium]